MANARMTVKKIFEQCQFRQHSHQKLQQSLKEVYESTPLDDFIEEFTHCLKYSFIMPERNPFVERTLEFVKTFALSLNTYASPNVANGTSQMSTDKEEAEEILSPILLKLFNFLLKIHTAHSPTVRLRVCQMVSKLMNGLGLSTTVDDNLYEQICQAMLDRLQDKIPAVRAQAAMALARLQEPSDEACPIIKAYLFHLSHDPHFDVRKAVLTSMAATSQTLLHALERTRDIKDVVRRAAYVFLAEKVHIKSLTIAQRVCVLQRGLNDRSDLVLKAVEQKLLPSWLKLHDNDSIKFLHSLDVAGCVKVAEATLKTLFKSQTPKELVSEFNLLDERHCIPENKLTCDNAFYWRCLAHYLKTEGVIGQEYLDCLLPELIPFCDYIKSYVRTVSDAWGFTELLDHDFISKQLLTLAGQYDLADLAGRNYLEKCLKELLLSPSVSVTLVGELVSCYKSIYINDAEKCLHCLTEIISDIREPIVVTTKEIEPVQRGQIELKIAKLRVELHEVRDHLEECLKNQEYSRAQEMKDRLGAIEAQKAEEEKALLPSSQECRTEKNDPQTILRCLMILAELLEQVTLRTISPTLQALIETMILTGIQNEDPAVRNEAVHVLGLCCMISRSLSQQHLVLFLQVSQVDHSIIRNTALRAIMDLLLLFGLDIFQAEAAPNNSPPHTTPQDMEDPNEVEEVVSQTPSNLMTILGVTLDSEDPEIRSTVAEGLCKLLATQRMYSPQLLSRLILLWYDPTVEGGSYISNVLGTFFPFFASLSKSNRECLDEAFLPTLCTIFDAPTSSPLYQIDPTNVARFLIGLTRPSNRNKGQIIEGSNIHDSLAEKICNHILKEPHSFHVRILAKSLTFLEISKQSYSTLKMLSSLCSKMLERVKEHSCLKYLHKFEKMISQPMSVLQQELSSSQLEAADSNVGSIRSSRVPSIVTSSSDDRQVPVTSPSVPSIITSSSDNGQQMPVTGVPFISNSVADTQSQDSSLSSISAKAQEVAESEDFDDERISPTPPLEASIQTCT